MYDAVLFPCIRWSEILDISGHLMPILSTWITPQLMIRQNWFTIGWPLQGKDVMKSLDFLLSVITAVRDEMKSF